MLLWDPLQSEAAGCPPAENRKTEKISKFLPHMNFFASFKNIQSTSEILISLHVNLHEYY